MSIGEVSVVAAYIAISWVCFAGAAAMLLWAIGAALGLLYVNCSEIYGEDRRRLRRRCERGERRGGKKRKRSPARRRSAGSSVLPPKFVHFIGVKNDDVMWLA
jgi:hypothetical protein